MDSKSIAYMNIAMIKYWCKNKYDPYLKPLVSSISLLSKKFYTETKIEKNSCDIFILNGEIQNEEETKKIFSFVNKIVPKREKIKIVSKNTMPTAAGLASSASAYCALTKELNRYFNLNFNKQKIAKVASIGSGSASRSLYNICAFTKYGDIYEIKSKLNLAMFVILISKDKKKISSRLAMQRCKETSPLIGTWMKNNEIYFKNAKKALKNNDFNTLGENMEKSTELMHLTMKTASPSFTYLNEESKNAIEYVKKVRENMGIEIYYTTDAGPNVKVLFQEKDRKKVYDILEKQFGKRIVEC